MYPELKTGGKSYLNYTRRKSHEEEVSFYKRFPWQLFCTFTFPRRLRNGDEEARWLWKVFINELEYEHRDTIGRLVAEERRSASGSLAAIRLHYHALFASDHLISVSLVRTIWNKYAGNGTTLSDIRVYDPRRNAVAYCLKLLGSMDGEFDIYNLDLYSPTPPSTLNRNSRSRRRWRRQMSRREWA